MVLFCIFRIYIAVFRKCFKFLEHFSEFIYTFLIIMLFDYAFWHFSLKTYTFSMLSTMYTRVYTINLFYQKYNKIKVVERHFSIYSMIIIVS
jgi:hypothetical protein